MLHGKLRLHELDDVEGVCVEAIRRSGLDLRYHDYEDCLAYLVEESWQLSLSYERGDFPSRFGVYLSRMLSKRLYDWQRKRSGRTRWTNPNGNAGTVYTRSLPSFHPLEHRPDEPDHSFLDHANAGGLEDVLGLQRARGSKTARGTEEASGAAA